MGREGACPRMADFLFPETILTPEGDHAASFRIVSVSEADADAAPSFIPHAVGRLESPTDAAAETLALGSVQARFTGAPYDEAWRAAALAKSGLEPGPAFSWVSQHWVHEREALAPQQGGGVKRSGYPGEVLRRTKQKTEIERDAPKATRI